MPPTVSTHRRENWPIGITADRNPAHRSSCRSFPKAEYVKHAWAGAWIVSIFRNEQAGPLASDMIRDAMAVMQTQYPVPALGCVTFVDPDKVRGVLERGERVKGFCFKKAGFRLVGETKKGLLAWQMLPGDMPAVRPVPEVA